MGADTESLPPEILSAAVAAFLGWKVDRRPGAHPDAAMRLAPEGREHELLRAVKNIIALSDGIRLRPDEWAGTDYGTMLKDALRARQPGLTPEAVDALASRLAFLQFN